MPVSPDLAAANFAFPQSLQQGSQPNTIASAATITVTNILTFLTGTVQLATINPPVSGAHMLVLVFTNGAPGQFLTTGNLQVAYQPIQNRPIILFYDPASAKYWVMSVT